MKKEEIIRSEIIDAACASRSRKSICRKNIANMWEGV